MKWFRNLIISTVLLFIFSIAAFAQDGKISGKVTYGDNTPSHGATVQIVQLKRTVVTDEEGNYIFENIPAGRYSVAVHNDGFADSTKTIDFSGGTDAALDFQLEISSIKEEVTVTASGTEQSTFEALQTVETIVSS